MNRSRRFSLFLCVSLLLGGLAKGQGVAILKEQVFHRDSVAVAVPYQRIIDSHGPFLRIADESGGMNVLRSKMVDWIEVPVTIPAYIENEKDVAPLRKSVKELQDFNQKYPKSAVLLENTIETLRSHIRRFDEGRIRFEREWMTNTEKETLLKKRRIVAEAERRIEIEKRIFYAAQRDKGLVLHKGKWLTKEQVEKISATARTQLSECVLPVIKGDLPGAKFAVNNLDNLAREQMGAAKVRTKRLATVVRNLFTAESRLVDHKLKGSALAHKVAISESNAKSWEQPNFFGAVNENAVETSRLDADALKEELAETLDSARNDLLFQLGQAESLIRDFYKLREFRVVLILDNAVRKVAARHFSEEEFTPTFPEEKLEKIRAALRNK